MVAGFAALLLLLGCGDFGDEDSSGRALDPGENQGVWPGEGGGGSGGSIDDGSELPPEIETTVDFHLPQASENFVYAANPNAGTVSIIDAKTLAIRTLETGDQPTYLRTLSGTDDAIVLNVGSDTATVVRSTATSVATSSLPVVSGANAIGVAPDGKHAVVYYDSSRPNAEGGSGSFQDVTVLVLGADAAGDRAVSMTVGFRPREVFFADDGKRAFVVNEDGVSVLDFAQIEKNGSEIAPLVSFGVGLDQRALDVSVTPDGHYALARAEGSSVLRLLELTTGNEKTLEVAEAFALAGLEADDDAGTPSVTPVEITDLDLMPAGQGAIAVLRNKSAMVELPIPAVFDDPSAAKVRVVSGAIVGSVTIAPAADHALLYTTAVNEERLTLVSLTDDSAPRTVALRKSVLAVAFTPDGKAALVTHKKLPGSPSEPGISQDEVVARSFGYSLVRVPEGNVKLQVTQTAVGPVAMVPDGSYMFLLFREDQAGVKEVHRVSLTSFLIDPIIQLESPPISIGTAPKSGKVFVNQDHPDGRMLFVNWQDPNDKKAVTGFALNSRIRD